MSDKLADIGESLVESFCLHGGINHLDGANLPSRQAIVSVTQDLLRLMFPGFYDEDPIPTNQIAPYAYELVSSVARRLENEIRRSLEYRPREPSERADVAGAALRVCREFLQALPNVRATLQTDVTAAYEGDPAAISTEEVILAYPGVEAIAVQRMAHLLYQQHVTLIPRIMTEWAHNKTGIDIHPGAADRAVFFHRPRHRRGDRRDRRHRQKRQALSGRDAWREKLPQGREGARWSRASSAIPISRTT